MKEGCRVLGEQEGLIGDLVDCERRESDWRRRVVNEIWSR